VYTNIVIRNVPEELKKRFDRDYHLWSAKIIELSKYMELGESIGTKKQDFIAFLLDLLEKEFLRLDEVHPSL